MLVKFLLNEATEPEREAVSLWLEADVQNRLYFQEFERIWKESRTLTAQSTVDVNAAWNRFRSRVQVNSRRNDARVRRMKWYRPVAAAAILLIALAGGWWWLNRDTTVRALAFQTLTKPMSDTLPDGSVVSLNSRSTLHYPSRFEKKQRKVKLKGEGFFAVKPDQKRPFQIETGDVVITVLGTSFNVKESSGAVEVVVETGRVMVEKDGRQVILNAGERIVVDSSADWNQQKDEQKDKLYQYYRTNSFVCDGTPLWRLAQVLEEAYAVRIEFARSSIRELRWDVTIENESLDQVLKLIQDTFDIKVRREGDRVIFE
jgi:ferric-dicitrate binding protein FerR (iron transport regulator)